MIKTLTISIEWKKSSMWGMNPHATAEVTHFDGTYETKTGYKASGCGYDKASTVVAAICNDFLLDRLKKKRTTTKHPYGIYCSKDRRSFNGGVGMACYIDIARFLGGRFEILASGQTFDVYRITFKGVKCKS